ncbi:MAG: glycosyltransferase [Pseudomonadota bacterium]
MEAQVQIPQHPQVVVALPCLNEAKVVVDAVSSLLEDPKAEQCRFLLLDGGSTDGTCDKVRAAFGDRVEIVENPRRLQSNAVNIAAQMAQDCGAPYLLRADLHAIYPVPFLSVLLETMSAEGADSVVIPMHTLGGNPVQNAAALVFSSWLGHGGSKHRTGKYRGWVDHGHHALFRTDAFLAAGGYDVEFVANEDAEFDVRLSAQGGKIFLENAVMIGYVPRNSIIATFKQFRRNGRYRMWTLVKHGTGLGLRQLLPIAVLPVLVVALLLSQVWPAFLLVPIGYLTALFCIVYLNRAASPTEVTPSLTGNAILVAAASHIGFSAGALYGLFELQVLKPKLKLRLRTRRHIGTGA